MCQPQVYQLSERRKTKMNFPCFSERSVAIAAHPRESEPRPAEQTVGRADILQASGMLSEQPRSLCPSPEFQCGAFFF